MLGLRRANVKTMAWVLSLLLPHLSTILGFALGALLLGHILVERRTSQGTLAWMLAIVLIPYVGVPLYLIFGGRKIKRRAAEKQRLYLPSKQHASGVVGLLTASGAPPPREGNRLTLLVSGEEAYRATIAAIESAKRSIHLSTLILAGDEVGIAVIERLTQKAREGLEVRVLIDAFFRFRAPRSLLRKLTRAGARVSWFMPVWHLPFRGHANLRLHRKALLIDGEVAIVGGMNIAREYMGPTPLEGRWRDVAAQLEGPAVADVAQIFSADWNFAARELLALPAPASAAAGEAIVQVAGSGPDAPDDPLYDAFLSAVFEAKSRLWIATPYFVPDDALTRALVLAVKRGVDVRVLAPLRSNHLTADLAGANCLREVEAAGAKLSMYGPGMLHAKILIADEIVGVVGSANFDMRSLLLDYELGLFTYRREEIEQLARWFESALPQCGPLPKAGRVRVLIEAVARLIGPLE